MRHFAATDPPTAFVTACWQAFRVAEVDDRVVAFCYVDRDLIGSIHVDPAAKARGIGTMLMNEAEDMIARDHATARLDVLALNTAAENFYRARGWVEVDRCVGDECGAPVETLKMHKHLSREA